MRLEAFRVQNFRSVIDSGLVEVSKLTALLGRNESGKSNLLKGLEALSSSEGFEKMSPIRDFPRHRLISECKDETKLVWTQWSLTEDERGELAEIYPRASSVTSVTVERPYAAKRYVALQGLPAFEVNADDVKSKVRKLAPTLKAAADNLEADAKARVDAAVDEFERAMATKREPGAWSDAAKAAIAALRKTLAAAQADTAGAADELLDRLQDAAEEAAANQSNSQAARDWVIGKLPTFIYVDEYSDLQGHQNIDAYLNRKGQNQLTEADRNFEKLCKVSGLNPSELQALSAQGDHETRNQLANRAGSVVTAELRRLWRDRKLKARFNLDGPYLDTLISDPTAIYDVEVNLNDRSRGLQWFFSFYVAFTADTRGGHAEESILLLDEPGLYLHAGSQADLLTHFSKDFENQILFTTHSPFMVPTDQLESVRTVNISEEAGTTVTNTPSGDSRTLFPLQAALGYNIAQGLFVGDKNLVVEGVTDYWTLQAVSEHCAEIGAVSLNPGITITPVGGAQKIHYMVALLSAERQKVLALLDYEKESKATSADLIKSKLIEERSVVFVADAFDVEPKEADLEDLFDPSAYEAAVREAYAKELAGREITPNASVPRIAVRMEMALRQIGVEFHETRVTKLILRKLASEPESVLSTESRARFEKLFKILNDGMDRLASRSSAPFS